MRVRTRTRRATMRDVRVAAAQFEHADGDKGYNLGRIRELSRRAADRGARWVCFHECSITGYTHLRRLDGASLRALAEPVPGGPSIRALEGIAREFGVVAMAGLIEIEPDTGKLRKCYAIAGPDGYIEKFHKLHPFIHPDIEPGERHLVIELDGARAGFLICYDNNLPENARITALMGADVIVMPHVTGCTPSPMPGRGEVDPRLWDARERDPVRLRMEFDGPKGRGWLMKWLPARMWENGVYGIFSNNVGRDGGTIKPGLSMILDPHGEIVDECRELGDGLAVGWLTARERELASGRRYLRARRPELYGRLSEPLPPGTRPVTEPGWNVRDPEPGSGS